MGGNSRWIYTLVKILLSGLAIGYVGFRLFQERDSLVESFSGMGISSLVWVIIAGLMIPLNLGLEAAKWRMLIRPFYPGIRLLPAMRAVLAGMATGIFTPNRVGEYAGRVLVLEPGSRLEAVLVTFIDRICQMTITLIAGITAMILLTGEVRGDLAGRLLGNPDLVRIFLAVAIAMLVITLVIILFPGITVGRILRLFGRKKWARKVNFAFENVPAQTVRKVLSLAALRYLVFSTQFLFLLHAFGYEGSIFSAYAMISLVFLGKSVIPFLGFMELGIREGIAIEVLGMIGVGAGTSFAATFVLYAFNILLPSAVGAYFVKEIKFQRTSA